MKTMVTLLRQENEKSFKETYHHGDVVAYLSISIEYLERIASHQYIPTFIILEANKLHKKLIHYTPALLWEVPSIILEIDEALLKIASSITTPNVEQNK